MRERSTDLSGQSSPALSVAGANAAADADQAWRVRDRALAAASNGIVISDPHQAGNPIIYCNPAFERITGYRPEEVLGRNCRFLQHPPDGRLREPGENEAALAELRSALLEKRDCHVLLRNYRKDSTPFWNELTVAPVFDARGQLTHFIGVQADTTERKELEEDLQRARRELESQVAKRTAELIRLNESLYQEVIDRHRAEQAARSAEAKYRGIFENAMEGIFQMSPTGRYLTANPAFATILGHQSPRELIAMVQDARREICASPDAWSAFEREINERGAVTGFEHQIRRKDGTLIWIAGSARAVRDKAGALLYYEGIIQEVTARKQAEAEKQLLEQQLRQAQKLEAVGTLVGGIAHDFNNILSAINGFSELCLADLPADSGTRDNVQQILTAGLRAKELVRQLLSLSRQDAPQFKPVSLTALVREVLKLLRAALPSTIRIQLSLESKRDVVVADPGQIHQVLMNLCANAGYAMRQQGGTLTVSLENLRLENRASGLVNNLEAGDYARLSVRDTGGGMEQAVLDRIFEPFFTTKPVGEGTGLGLSVVHGIIKNHGGDIIVRSRPGIGTTFQVLMPLAEAEAARTLDRAAPLAGQGERVMFVDDEEAHARMVTKMLTRLGYQVVAHTDSETALATLTAQPQEFDLLITDQTMPRLTGLQLASQLRRATINIPIIVCTGHSLPGTREAAREAGVSACIGKPIDFHQLTVAMRRILDERKAAPTGLVAAVAAD